MSLCACWMGACLLLPFASRPGVADSTAEPQTVPLPIKGVDLDGALHRIAETEGRRGAAFVFLSTTCPISNGYLPQLNTLAARSCRLKVDLYGVISDRSVNRAEARRHRDDFGISFPVLFDASGDLRRQLGATHTPHAFVISITGERLYAGRIDNLYSELGRRRDSATVHDFRDAVEALAIGGDVAAAVTTPIGCLLEDPPDLDSAGAVTFNRDIAPILYANCSECHRTGEAAPFALLSYNDAVRHARQIAAVTQTKFMPPWHAVAGFGRFRNQRGLTGGEIDLIRHWVEDGMPEGEEDDLVAPPSFTEGWRLGKPDLILTMKEAFELEADGADVHQHFVLPTRLRRNRLVSAVEFRPGNPRVAHHASFYVDTTGAARKLQALAPDVGYGGFVGPGFPNVGSLRSWLPGMTPQRLPKGTGQALHAHSDLVVEIHYRKSGKAEIDRSKVGIHFAKSSARQLVSEIQVMNKVLTIPAGAKRHHHTASFTLPVDATLLDTAPHMHLLGREMKAVAVRPDGATVPLVWIKDWDFNWQEQYLYAEPITLPQGTRINVDAWYDNSEDNPLNPWSPPREVRWGEQTRDEMAVCHFRYTCRTAADLNTLNKHYVRYSADQQRRYRRATNQAE